MLFLRFAIVHVLSCFLQLYWHSMACFLSPFEQQEILHFTRNMNALKFIYFCPVLHNFFPLYQSSVKDSTECLCVCSVYSNLWITEAWIVRQVEKISKCMFTYIKQDYINEECFHSTMETAALFVYTQKEINTFCGKMD